MRLSGANVQNYARSEWEMAEPLQKAKKDEIGSQSSTSRVADISVDEIQRGARVRRTAPTTDNAVPPASTLEAKAAGAQETLSDLPIEPNSLIAARVIAVRRLLGEESVGRDDEEMLELANQIHQAAQSHPDNATMTELSEAVYVQECAVWGEHNGASDLGLAPEAVMTAYQEAWSLALNPPPAPVFKTRLELAAQVDSKTLQKWAMELDFAPGGAPVGRTGSGNVLFKPREKQLQWLSEHPTIIKQYYQQFSDYTDRYLERLCTAKALSNAAEAGLPPLMLEHQPQQAWTVKLRRIEPGNATTMPGGFLAEGCLFSMPGGSFGLTLPDGTFRSLKRPASAKDDEWVRQPENLKKLFGEHWPTTISPSNVSAMHLPIEAPSSIKALLKQNIHGTAQTKIQEWKENNYNPSAIETVFRVVIPFYETVHKLQNDPGYRLTFGDVAWDVFDLGLTVATIGFSAGLPKAISAGVKAAKAIQGASAAARASAGIRAGLSAIKTGNFLMIAGRELTDFIVPVFTAQGLVKAAGKGSMKAAREGLSALSRQLSQASASDGSALLNRIYETLFKTHRVPNSAAATKALMEQRAAVPVPPTLYRGQTVNGDANFLASKWGTVDEATRDAYLAACIRHSSRTGGSEGEVLSLSMEEAVAKRFAGNRQDGKVLEINTTAAPPGSFLNIEEICLRYGPDLVAKGWIKPGTLASAIEKSTNQAEKEVFCILGSIPDAWITLRQKRSVNLAWA